MTMSLSYTLYKKEEIDLYSILVSDIRVMRYITEKEESEIEAKINFKKILNYNTTYEDGTGYYKVMNGSQYIGFAKLSWTEKNEIEIGYMILPDQWRKGYGGQIIEDLLNKVRNSSILSKFPLLAIIDPNNDASKYLLMKNNFVSTWQGIEDNLPTEYLYWVPNKKKR